MKGSNTGQRETSRVHEPGTSTPVEIDYRVGLESYFDDSVGSNVEKLESFAKFVPRQNLTTFIAKYELFKKVLDVPGSIIECGVYLGAGLMTFAQLSAIFEPFHYKRKIIGFDTFSGFTGISPQDMTNKSAHAKEGGFSVDADVYEDLKTSVSLYDSNRPIGHIPKVITVKGDITETLPKYLEENPHTIVSLLYLDMDVFQPTRAALDLLVSRMPKGAVIAFDELNDERWPGETLAAIESVGLPNLRLQRFPFDPYMSFAQIE